MRQDAYSSPVKRVLVVAIPVALAIAIAIGIFQSSASPPPPPTATSTQGVPGPTNPATQPTTANPVDDLADAVFAFEETFNLTPSKERNERLKGMTTSDGYEFVYRDPDRKSLADQGSEGISYQVVRDSDSTVQAEPFDESDLTIVSVASRVKMSIIKEGTVLETRQFPLRISSWIKQDGTWKLAHIQQF